MVDVIISAVISAVLIAICCCYLKYNQIKCSRSFAEILPKNVKQVFFLMGMVVTSAAVVVILSVIYDVTWIFTVKRLVVCTSLWAISLIDYRQHIIPNKILCVMLITRVAIGIPEFIIDFQSAKKEVISCLIAAVCILIILCLMRFVVRDGIGFGDIKLFTVLGLFFGLKGAVPAIFLSFVVSLFIAVFLLITKKRKRTEQIAFAPAILIGTLLSVILFGA